MTEDVRVAQAELPGSQDAIELYENVMTYYVEAQSQAQIVHYASSGTATLPLSVR